MSKVIKIPSEERNHKKRNFIRDPFFVALSSDASLHRKAKRSPSHDAKVDEEVNDDNETSTLDEALSKKILSLVAENQFNDSDTDQNDAHRANENLELSDKVNSLNESETFIENIDECMISDAEKFLSNNTTNDTQKKTVSLTDLIYEKLLNAEKKEKSQLSDKVIQVYQAIGDYMSKYKSGKLPKAFKIIPSLTNWQEVLCLTNPETWTPNAMYQSVRIFSSNLKPHMAHSFYNLILLPAVRNDIQQNKKLNFHYYQSLKLAFYKPSAWFQGILFPLLNSDCTLREAVIIGSILGKLSIPPLHVAAALIRLCDLHQGNILNWSICTTYIINVLLNKKCALPKTAINAVVNHFKSFMTDSRQLPVLWFQTFLTLVQRYKLDFTCEHKTIFRNLLKIHYHHLLTDEIRRELNYSENLSLTNVLA